MDAEHIPRTLAVIPDGNRRWSSKHKLSLLNGYGIGVKKLIEFDEWCNIFGIKSVTVWILSKENLSRSKEEVGILFKIYRKLANDKNLIAQLHKNQTRLQIVGDINVLPSDIVKSLRKLEAQTEGYQRRILNLLVGYGGRDDILHAAKKAAMEFMNKSTAKFEDLFQRSLISCGIADIDLIIRTSGEQRLSGFMPWQSNYSELYFSKKLWPDFTKNDLKRALSEYSRRQRRFGK